MRESNRAITFCCPITDKQVQSVIDDDLIGPDTIIVPVDCPICNRRTSSIQARNPTNRPPSGARIITLC